MDEQRALGYANVAVLTTLRAPGGCSNLLMYVDFEVPLCMGEENTCLFAYYKIQWL